MSNIDRNAANLQPIEDAFVGSNKNVMGKKKKAFLGATTPAKKGGKGPSAKVSNPTKTTGKFGGKGKK